jgi:hypothetical protein
MLIEQTHIEPVLAAALDALLAMEERHDVAR